MIGAIVGNVLVRDCAPLTSGAGFSLTYFSLRLLAPAPADAFVASVYQTTPDAISAVHPRIATSQGVTLITSLNDGLWLGDPNNPSGRALPVAGLPADAYRLGMEKLDSPLRSITTPPYSIAIALNPNDF